MRLTAFVVVNLLTIAAITLAKPREVQPGYLDLFEEPFQEGEVRNIDDNVPDLSHYNFDDRASSYCVNGIFLLHQYPNFNKDNRGATTYWVYNPWYACNNIKDQFNNQASSVRFVGVQHDFEASSINFYLGESFNGQNHFYTKDATIMTYDKTGSSIIVTGCDPWTLYEYDNYGGKAICIYPDANCYPGFYPLISDLGGFDNMVSSVRRGCFAENEIVPPQVSEEKDAMVVGKF